VVGGRATIQDALGVQPAAPDQMLGSMASVPLPVEPWFDGVALQRALLAEHAIEVPIVGWPVPAAGPVARWLVRISGQAYNAPADYALLARALRGLLAGR
jgi:isopenicillin-N epimerase